MSWVNKATFLVQYELCECMQFKGKSMMMKIGVSVKNQMVAIVVKMIICVYMCLYKMSIW